MKCEFSETQFAFNYTFEILKKYTNLRNPFFPNIRQEGGPDGGYDVKLDFEVEGSVFLQFKIPMYHKRINKYQIRFETNQLELLRQKVIKELQYDKPANLVYYAAPNFHTCKDLENFYYNEEIELNSALFPVEDFPKFTQKHTLKYAFREVELQDQGVLIEQFPENGHRFINHDKEKIYGLINSTPKGIEISPTIFSKPNYEPSIMLLSKKAEFLLDKLKN